MGTKERSGITLAFGITPKVHWKSPQSLQSSSFFIYGIGGASCTIGSRRGIFLHQKDAKKFGSKRRSFDKEEKAKKWKVTAEKPEEREAKTKEKASRKLKASHSADLKPHRKEAIDKKVDKIQKVTSVSRNSPEKDTAKIQKCVKVFRGSQKLNRTIDSWQQSKDVAKDWLEGALDREGSLVILSKLHRKLQKLKEVIRDSFVRQKLVENTESVKKGKLFSIYGFVLGYSLHQLNPEFYVSYDQ
ncbi:hypothetical protein FF1_026198 [Malus domestica]